MSAFLSPEWFAEVKAESDDPPAAVDPLVLEQVVRGTPYGEVRYQVVAAAGRAGIVAAVHPSDLTILCDWATATAIAEGRLSTQRALMQGRLRVRGSTARLAERVGELAGLDPIPPAVRRNTTFGDPLPESPGRG